MRGAPLFDDAVRESVMQWRYQPYKIGNVVVPACFPVYFNFNIKDAR